jgi:hypothetical protein
MSTFFTHAKDLLLALEREKPPRPHVIIVTHSIGRLLVKEFLRRSDESDETELIDIIRSTIGVNFLGTPHRGSSADLGESMRCKVSAIARVDSYSSLLRTLGAYSAELELIQEVSKSSKQRRHFSQGATIITFSRPFPPSVLPTRAPTPFAHLFSSWLF